MVRSSTRRINRKHSCNSDPGDGRQRISYDSGEPILMKEGDRGLETGDPIMDYTFYKGRVIPKRKKYTREQLLEEIKNSNFGLKIPTKVLQDLKYNVLDRRQRLIDNLEQDEYREYMERQHKMYDRQSKIQDLKDFFDNFDKNKCNTSVKKRKLTAREKQTQQFRDFSSNLDRNKFHTPCQSPNEEENVRGCIAFGNKRKTKKHRTKKHRTKKHRKSKCQLRRKRKHNKK